MYKRQVENYILPWNGDETDFDAVMDALNDPVNRKDLGAFYTPLPYVKEATKLVRQAIGSLPKGCLLYTSCCIANSFNTFFRHNIILKE